MHQNDVQGETCLIEVFAGSNRKSEAGPEVIKLFFILNSSEHVFFFFLLINVKMLTIVGF